MGKILRLFKNDPEDLVVGRLTEIANKAQNGEFQNFVFAGYMPKEDQVATAWGNADPPTCQELLSNIQIDIIAAVMEHQYGLAKRGPQ
jgi:hypothetical protein